jgi:hypothetical protein
MNNFTRFPSYRPPPPPPSPQPQSVDPLVALSQSPTMLAGQAPIQEELADLLEDADIEPYGQNGTKIMPRPAATPVYAHPVTPLPPALHYPPVMIQTIMQAPPKNNTPVILAVMGVMILMAGAGVTLVAVLWSYFG